jgi:8-oxo-dGTP pyrophosphatase MutT (NUDIX family)
MAAMDDAVPIRPAATILLLRDAPEFQVLMVKRHHQIDFASGALVFPGGKAHAGDEAPAWEDLSVGWASFPEDQRALRVAAIREVYEEAGVLLARHDDDVAFCGHERASDAREAVSRDPGLFPDLVASLGLRLDLGALTVFARWITPPLTPKRFDTWFFVTEASSDQLALCDGYETVDAEWISPARALELAAAGERKVIFPTRMNLQLLAQSASAAEAIAHAAERRLFTVEPRVEGTGDDRVLVIPPEAGYGDVAEPLSTAL